MNWKTMIEIEPELARLATSAEHAGKHGASWLAVLAAGHEQLTKLTGRGAFHEALQDGRSYEISRAAIYASWARGAKDAGHVSKIGNPPRPQAKPTVCQPVDEQHELFDTSEIYR